MEDSIFSGSEVTKNTEWLISTDDVFLLMDRLDPSTSKFDFVTQSNE